jgi:hypothetical protein
MTDRELLELAASAAGIDWIKNCVWIENGFYSPLATHERISWNPLTDDGDALRLAVKLRIDISMYDEKIGRVYAYCKHLLGFGTDGEASYQNHAPIEQAYGDDPCAATRRAIVRAAAAEIGRLK